MKRRISHRGAALVEMALVFPILSILLLGTIQFGLVLREHQIVQNAAREGARFASRLQPTEDAVRTVVKGYLAQENVSFTDSDITVDRAYDLGPGIGPCGSRVTVTHRTSPIVGTTLFGDFSYTSEAVFRNLVQKC